MEHKARYDRAKEFADVVHSLWDSWEDDAFVGDKATARFVDTSKVHAINHCGQYYSVAGPLNVPRSPQGRPVTVQAGGSSDVIYYHNMSYMRFGDIGHGVCFSHRLGKPPRF